MKHTRVPSIKVRQASIVTASTASLYSSDSFGYETTECLLPAFVQLYEKFETEYLQFREEANRLVGARTTPVNVDALAAMLKATELESRAIQGTLELRKSQAKLSQETARNLNLMRASKGLTKGATSLLTGFKTIKT